MLGLLQAARSFDPTRGVDFAGFAKVRIRGALLDELRSRDWASRSVRGLARRAEGAVDDLTATLHRAPSTSEVAAQLGVDVATITQLTADVDRATVLNYESVVLGGADGESVLPAMEPDPEAQVLARERVNYLHDAVGVLPERLRHVVVASFFEDRSLQDIADELGVTESRVSQIRTEALGLLREGMSSQLEPEALPVEARPDGRVAKRKAAYYAAVASASDYRARLNSGSQAVAERVALAGLGS